MPVQLKQDDRLPRTAAPQRSQVLLQIPAKAHRRPGAKRLFVFEVFEVGFFSEVFIVLVEVQVEV
jgi:hypothetical protein